MAFDLRLDLFLYFGISWKILLFSGKVLICPGKFCDFRGKKYILISPENFLVRPEIFCHFLEKMWYVRKNFWYVRKIFWDDLPSLPPSPTFSGKNVRYPSQSKSAPRSLPPQLLDASYAPVTYCTLPQAQYTSSSSEISDIVYLYFRTVQL